MTTTKFERPTGPPMTAGGIESLSRPTDLSGDQLALTRQTGTATIGTGETNLTRNAPILHPPGTAGADGATASIAGSWQTKQILALFSTRAARSGWAYLDGVGWRKFPTNNDSAHMAIGQLASAARVAGGPVVTREEADGSLHEIYFW